jgi:hypothetical protein
VSRDDRLTRDDAAVGLGLFLDPLTLLLLVFSQRRPQTASDPAALPATGGPSA